MQDKAPIRSQTLGPAMPGNVSVQSTGQHKGNELGQSQHGSDWDDVRENSELSIPAVYSPAHALAHTVLAVRNAYVSHNSIAGWR